MKTTHRVVWSEGLLMTPQHMQQLDHYHEQLLASRLDALDPLNWGVIVAELDRRALSTGHVRLQEFTGVLPDGLCVQLDQDHPELPPSRSVEGHFPHSQPILEVYLGVPREREGSKNYSEGGAARTRFVMFERTVPDSTAAGQAISVAFARRNVVVLFGDEPRDDYESIKIAEVVRDDAGTLVVSEPYVPPSLRVSASPFLIAGLRRILSLMTTRQRALSEARRQRDASSVEFGPGDVTRFLLLNAIHTFLPVMNYMVDAGDLHPRTCYLQLVQLAGQLATFSATEDPSTLPKFVYTDLRGTFEELFARIVALLRATVREHFFSLPLESRQDGVHVGKLDERFASGERFLISVKSTLPEQQVANQLPRLSKIASWGDINGILSSAMPGVPAEVTFRPPPEIPIKANLVYFTLSTENLYWRNVLAERSVAVYLPRPFEPQNTTVELLTVPSARH